MYFKKEVIFLTAIISATLAIVVLAFVYIVGSFFKIRKMDEGTEEMKKLAKIIRDGANTFIKIEFKTIIITVAILALAISLFVEATAGITFLIGASMSAAICKLGMVSATYAGVRTANKSRQTYRKLGKIRSTFETMKVALIGGRVPGLGVQAFGTFGVLLIIIIFGEITPDAQGHGLLLNTICNPTITRITTYSLGCSIVAMFNRVAGGNFTKAADISSDIVGKNRLGLNEDDPRIPSVAADFVGDNVNDIAGNCSDLLESYVATIAASIMMAVIVFGNSSAELFKAAIIFPIAIAGIGMLSCLIGIGLASCIKMSNSASKQLNMATYISAAITMIGSLVAAYFVFGGFNILHADFKLGWISPWIAAIIGIVSGVLIGIITEIFTSDKYPYVKNIAKISKEGPAFNFTMGDATGFISCFPPMALIGIAIMISSAVCGNYGIAISALGMLSFVGTTVSIDAFGPIADNAGGIVEACKLDEELRTVTDELDSVGNTTAAIGKGFAIGSAAFATISMIISFTGGAALNIASGKVMGGAIFGGIIALFSGWLGRNTIKSAQAMAEESMEQLRQPGIIEGTKKPDYQKCIGIATNRALKKMLAPSMVAIVVPIVCGLIFGKEFVGGLLVGATIIAIMLAIFMGNSGGAFDNAKKFIEAGGVEGCGKGSPAHKAAVEGDTSGDTRKDVIGVALDIFIKMMSTVANTLAPLFRL